MPAKKYLSQYFLTNKKYLQKISAAVKAEGGYPILEIGAGRGELTEFLLQKNAPLECVEIDPELIKILRNKFTEKTALTIVPADIREYVVDKHFSAVVGNIPYHLSFDIIEFLINNRKKINKAFLTVQKEFARKLCACISTKDYGYLTVFTSLYMQKKILFNIPKRYFHPEPNVDSALVEFDIMPDSGFIVNDENAFSNFLRKSFSLRRKKILNVVKKQFGCPAPERMLVSADIPPDLRPDAISLNQYIRLYKCLYNS